MGKDALVVDKPMAKSMLIVKSKIKDVVKGFNVGGDLADSLNEIANWAVTQAAARAEK